MISLFKERSISSKCYILSFTCFLLHFLLSIFLQNNEWLIFLFILSIVLLEIGFFFWLCIKIKTLKDTNISKWLLIVLHLLVLIFAAGASRDLVAHSLGLPAEDFELTSSLFVLIFYIPCWIAFVAILLTFVFWVCYVISIMLMILKYPFIDASVKWLALKLGLIEYSKGVPISIIVKHFATALGAGIGASMLMFIFVILANNQEKLYPLVRYSAFLLDYRKISNYPELSYLEKVQLHENGIYSYPEFINGELIIKVGKIQ